MRKRVIAALLILLCTVMTLILPAVAAGSGAEIPEGPSGKSRLTLQYKYGSEALSGATFYLCKVGTYSWNAETSVYDLTKAADFDDADLSSLPGLNSWKDWSDGSVAEKTGTQADALVKYVQEKRITSSAYATTNDEGTAIINDLDPGLYLVRGNKIKDGKTVYTPQTFLIPLPYPKEDSFIYNVTAKVKAEKKEGLTARKIWKDENGNEVDPSPDASVTTQLYHNNEPYEESGVGRQVLNAANNWTYTWEELDYDVYSAWTVKETGVPEGYTAKIDWDANTWTWIITNTKTNETEPEPDDPDSPGPVYDSITVTKIWKRGSSDPPASVTVRLYCTDTDCTEESQEAELKYENNWSYTWEKLDTGSSHTWKVEEDAPDGYKASYEQGKNVWTITNTATESPPGNPVNPGPSDPVNPGPGPGSRPSPDKPVLNTKDHYAYLIGYEDGTIRPDANITRAEAVTIFFRLLTDVVRNEYWTTTNPYPDVVRSAWYNNAISTMTKLGIVDGYPDGSFRPNANITRAELTKIAVSFFQYADLHLTGSTRFNDVPQGLWYTRFIEAATELGLIEGYPDNTFRPENAITRAETVTIVNRALGRKPHRDGLLENMITWPDNMNKYSWYYADIQEATNSHDYQMGLYSSDGTWYYPDDLHSQDYRMGWDRSIGTWNWTDDLRSQDFLMCWHKPDGKWYYTDMREADGPHDFVICQHKSDGTWTWRYADDIQGNTASANFPMVPYDGRWDYPDDADTDAHDFLMCWHKSDGSRTWYYADDLRENTSSHNFQMVLYGTDGAYENWTALLPVRDWAAFERMWAELHPEVWNPGEVMDRDLPNENMPGVKSEKKREEEPDD